MADGRKNNGSKKGGNPGAGRPAKADEIRIIEAMDAALAPAIVWKSLANKVKEGDGQCIKTWLSYRYGMPKQTIDQNTSITMNDFNVKDVLKIDTPKK